MSETASGDVGPWDMVARMESLEAERDALQAEVERLRTRPCPWCSYPKEPQTP